MFSATGLRGGIDCGGAASSVRRTTSTAICGGGKKFAASIRTGYTRPIFGRCGLRKAGLEQDAT